jgi:glycerophosphoryl diester phosphodiesterase
MEEMITELIRQRNLEEHVIYSTFYAHSVKRLRELVPDAEIGILDRRLSDCLYKMQGGCGANALHPFWRGIDIEADKGTPVRAWFSGHLFPEKPTGNRLDLETLEQQGITDVFLNEPEVYL